MISDSVVALAAAIHKAIDRDAAYLLGYAAKRLAADRRHVDRYLADYQRAEEGLRRHKADADADWCCWCAGRWPCLDWADHTASRDSALTGLTELADTYHATGEKP